MAFVSAPVFPVRNSHTSLSRCRPRMTAVTPKTFAITKTVMPADSDYSAALWHGSYIRYLEEARVRYLAYRRLPYDDLVNTHATELVVRDIAIRYIAPARLGDELEISIRMGAGSKVRIVIESDFIRKSDSVVCASAEVTIVPIDVATGKVRRTWPKVLSDALLGE